MLSWLTSDEGKGELEGLGGLSKQTVGVILMVIGVLGIVLEFAMFRPRTQRTTSVTTADPVSGTTRRETMRRDL